MKRVAFKTLGCRLNQAETATIKAGFRQAGYTLVAFGEVAEVCVVHTCTITAAAENECTRLARRIKRRTPEAIVVLAGCAGEVSADRLRAATNADLVVGHADKHRLPALIASLSREAVTEDRPDGRNSHEFRSGDFSLPLQPSNINLPPSCIPYFDTTRAWVKAQDGCSFHCAYCIVPRARGDSRSRPAVQVVEEVKALAGAGHREVVVTGANLGTYRDGSRGLTDLLQRIEAIPGIRRIRISSIEISTTEREIIEYMAASAKLCHFLHLPLQSGDDHLLQRMGRRYTRADYRKLIEFVIDKMPRAGIGTDLLTGLPGEDTAAFANTLSFVAALPFSNLHVFPYSRRPGTRAASMPDQVPTRIARQRAAELIALGKEKRHAFTRQFIDRPVEVLIEKVDVSGMASGWTAEYLRAEVPRPEAHPNDLIRFIPRHANEGTLRE